MATRNHKEIIPVPRELFSGFCFSKLSRKIGVHRSNFYKWQKVPLDYVLELERVTGIERHVMRPDFYKS